MAASITKLNQRALTIFPNNQSPVNTYILVLLIIMWWYKSIPNFWLLERNSATLDPNRIRRSCPHGVVWTAVVVASSYRARFHEQKRRLSRKEEAVIMIVLQDGLSILSTNNLINVTYWGRRKDHHGIGPLTLCMFFFSVLLFNILKYACRKHYYTVHYKLLQKFLRKFQTWLIELLDACHHPY